MDAAVAEATVERFTSRGWIDDAVLAEQLLYAGTSRKGQGRRAIAQTLSARGIARDVADAALATLPDDDDERALEYARSKAHGLRSYDLETAMRRLMGQLARRGYSGSVAANAARTALTEQRDERRGAVPLTVSAPALSFRADSRWPHLHPAARPASCEFSGP